MRKKYMVLLGIAVAILLTPLALTGAAQATGFRSGNVVTVAKSEVVDSTLFVSGQTVEIAGEVNGDVFCAGNAITITGTVHGDVICAGQTVNVRGTVDGDVRVAGAIVTIEAKVTGNTSVIGQTIALHSDAKVKDFQAAGSEISVAGTVDRDASIAGSLLTIDGIVGRNVIAAGEEVGLGPHAKITGNLEYTSHPEIQKANGAVVSGQTKHNIPQDDHRDDEMNEFFSGAKWFFAASGLITSILIVLIAPRLLYGISTRGTGQPGMSVLAGLGTNISVVVVAIILSMTIIGLPLAGLLLLAWTVLVLLSLPVFSFYLGRILLARSTNNLLYYMLLGSVIVFLLNFVPVAGGIVLFLGSIFGVGMIVMTIARHLAKPRYTLDSPRTKKA